MASITTQLADMADLEVLVGLFVEFRNSLRRSTPSEAQFRASIRLLLGNNNVRVFLAKVDGAPAGYVSERYYLSAWASGREAVLDDLFVLAEYRERGVGKRLVEHAIRDALQSGCRTMSLDTNEQNDASNALYKKLGFTCERPRWSGGRQIRYDLNLDALREKQPASV